MHLEMPFEIYHLRWFQIWIAAALENMPMHLELLFEICLLRLFQLMLDLALFGNQILSWNIQGWVLCFVPPSENLTFLGIQDCNLSRGNESDSCLWQIHEPSTSMANINGNLQHGHLCRKQPILLVRFCQKTKLIFFEIKNEIILEVFNCQIWGKKKKRRSKNCQIFISNFQCVAINIKWWLQIEASSMLWHFECMSTKLLPYKDICILSTFNDLLMC